MSGVRWEEPPPLAVGPEPEAVRAWLEATCAAQGVPVHVTDPVVLAKIRVLFTGA